VLIATIDVGNRTSHLRISDGEQEIVSLNLMWGHGGGNTPQERADVLLAQNGNARIGDWDEGNAHVEADRTPGAAPAGAAANEPSPTPTAPNTAPPPGDRNPDA
jgi:hypothetical protein